MTPKQIAKQLGDMDEAKVEAALAAIANAPVADVAKAIRAGFEKGNEQGNFRRLETLVKLESEGCLDVICAVLEDKVEVGGKYSNLRNGALELIRDNFLGHAKLEKSLWRAIEIDEYLSIDDLYKVVKPYDAKRAIELLIPAAASGIPAAIEELAKEQSARPALLDLLDKVLAKADDAADRFVEALGAVAAEPAFAAKLAPHAERLPTVAAAAIYTGDHAKITALADHVSSKNDRWRAVGQRALEALTPAEVFDRVSAMLAAKDRAKPNARHSIFFILARLDKLPKPFDARWLAFVKKQLAKEEHLEVRGFLVQILGALGPEAAPLAIAAAKDDKDKYVLAAMADALAEIGPGDGVRELVETALERAKGKHKRRLEDALGMMED